MHRNLLLWPCLLLALFAATTVEAKGPAVKEPAAKEPAAKEPAATEPAAKELSGMSIVGSDEAPKSLYIVPWKSSEIGMETSLSMMLTDNAVPVDREVFMRQLNFFEISTRK